MFQKWKDKLEIVCITISYQPTIILIKNKYGQRKQPFKKALLANQAVSKLCTNSKCVPCSDTHKLYFCEQFLNMQVLIIKILSTICYVSTTCCYLVINLINARLVIEKMW